MRTEIIKKIRKAYFISSLILGILTPSICIYLFPEFDPRTQPISYFGILQNTSLIFLISLIIFAIAIFWNGITIVQKIIKNIRYKLLLKILLLISSICLFLTGLIPMNFGPLHKIPALCFFLVYNFFIFLFGIARSRSYVRKGLFSVLIGSLMLLSSLLLIPFPSYGVAEVVYIFLIFLWNVVMWIQQQKLKRI